MRSYAFAITLALAACSSASEEAPIEYVQMAITVRDDPSTQSVRLSYTNDTGSKLCVGPDHWPSTGGIIDNNGEEIFLMVDSETYFLKQEQDYCPRCTIEVAQGERLDGMIPYANFGLPAEKWNSPKVLSFTPTVWKCPRGPEY